MSNPPGESYPTERDIENAVARACIAQKQNQEYDHVQLLALRALGPGWKPWMKIVLLDADHRRSGDTTPVATVYKVYRGEEKLTENSLFIRQLPDGTITKATSYEPLFGE